MPPDKYLRKNTAKLKTYYKNLKFRRENKHDERCIWSIQQRNKRIMWQWNVWVVLFSIVIRLISFFGSLLIVQK